MITTPLCNIAIICAIAQALHESLSLLLLVLYGNTLISQKILVDGCGSSGCGGGGPVEALR